MLLIDTPINIEFYFTFDGLIVIHNTDYKVVQDVYNKYYKTKSGAATYICSSSIFHLL